MIGHAEPVLGEAASRLTVAGWLAD